MGRCIAVVDDLTVDRSKLMSDIRSWLHTHRLLQEYPCSAFASGVEFLRGGGLAGKYSIVFLDICMEALDGIQTAEKLRLTHPEVKVVFVTSEAGYALTAYSVHPFDYLVKPWSSQRLDRLMTDLFGALEEKTVEIDIRIAHGTMRIPVHRILSVESHGHGVEYFLDRDASLSSISSFSETELMLSAFPSFLTINRGVMINMDQAIHIKEGCIVMSNGVQYPLRVRRQSELIRLFTQYQVSHRMGGG